MTDLNHPSTEKKPKHKKSQPVIPPNDYPDGPGRTTVAPEVLQSIARLTALETPGISRMSAVPGGVSRLRKGAGEGVLLDIQDDSVTTDLYVVVKNNVNMREVSRHTQHNVARAISEMVGMQVGRVNIHIEDIDFLSE
jgi:uncharacterized alkaline shock family protein YloU